MTIKGIDVSVWQPKIDWAKVKNSGISFAILRGAYGTSTDTKFAEHIKGAQAHGIDVGVYVYSIASTIAEAEKEAEHILNVIKPYRLTYPVVYDIEDEKQAGLDKDTRTKLCIAFCEKIENAGYYAMIYANKYWLETKLDYEKLKVYDIWLAQWASKATWTGNYGIWQQGQQYVDGIGNCDVNIAYKDYPTIIKNAGLNNIGKIDTPIPPVTNPSTNTPANPPVSSGYKIGDLVSIKPGAVWGGLASTRGQKVNLNFGNVYKITQIAIHKNVEEALLQPINSWVATSSLALKSSAASPAPKTITVGSKVSYKGYVQYSSWGTGGKPIYVSGIFTVKQIIKDRQYGVLIDQLGWVAEKDCKVI